jgi:O-acetyl-ADP-ribose deacetylase (regulator of RNase III)
LQHGGGIAGKIAEKAGPSFQLDSDKYIRTQGQLTAGHACYTSAGNLPYRAVIHAVGPMYDAKENRNHLLESAVMNSLKIATEQRCSSIAIPTLSAGIFGFPLDISVRVIHVNIAAYRLVLCISCI